MTFGNLLAKDMPWGVKKWEMYKNNSHGYI